MSQVWESPKGYCAMDFTINNDELMIMRQYWRGGEGIYYNIKTEEPSE